MLRKSFASEQIVASKITNLSSNVYGEDDLRRYLKLLLRDPIKRQGPWSSRSLSD